MSILAVPFIGVYFELLSRLGYPVQDQFTGRLNYNKTWRAYSVELDPQRCCFSLQIHSSFAAQIVQVDADWLHERYSCCNTFFMA